MHTLIVAIHAIVIFHRSSANSCLAVELRGQRTGPRVTSVFARALLSIALDAMQASTLGI